MTRNRMDKTRSRLIRILPAILLEFTEELKGYHPAWLWFCRALFRRRNASPMCIDASASRLSAPPLPLLLLLLLLLLLPLQRHTYIRTRVALRKHYVNNNKRVLCRRAEQRFDVDCCRQPTGDESSYLSRSGGHALTQAKPTKAMRHGRERETR